MKQTLRALLIWTLALLLLAGAVPVSALFAPGWDNWSDGVEETWKTAYAAGETAIRAQNILGPINPHASREAKNLYAYLAVMSDSERFLTGTFDISTSDNVYNQVVREYGLEPALYSNRYIVDTTEPEMEENEDGTYTIVNSSLNFTNVAAANRKLKAHYENGNVLLVHSDSEVPSMAGRWASGLGLYPMDSNGYVANAIQELDRTNPDRNMEVYAIWQKFMYNEIAALKSLEDDYGVKAYLWRPWIELNYKPFNGNNRVAYEAFTRVFQQNVEALIDAGLTGFLVTYSPGSAGNTITRYPGNDYVDVLSVTMYSYSTDLGALKSDAFDNYGWYVHAGKPMGFSELSCRSGNWKQQGSDPRASWYDLLQDVIEHWPGIAWVNCWGDGSYSLIDNDFAVGGNDDGKLFMDSPFTLDLSEILDYRHVELEAPGVAQLFRTQDASDAYLALEERVYTQAELQALGFTLSELRALHLNRNFRITFYTGADGASGTAKTYDVSGKGITAAEMAGFRSCAVEYQAEEIVTSVTGASYRTVTSLDQLPESSADTHDCNYASLIRGKQAYSGAQVGKLLTAVGGSSITAQTDGKYQGLDESVHYKTSATQQSLTLNGVTYASEPVPQNSLGYSGYWSYVASGWIDTDANLTRTVFYSNTDTEWGRGIKLYYDMGSVKTIGSLIIGSTTDITAWKIGNLIGTVPTTEEMLQYKLEGYGQSSYLYAGKVYVGNDPATLYSDANLVMEYDWSQSWASMKRALRNLYTLENSATGRYVGFVFPTFENQVRISELAVYAAHNSTVTVTPATCTSNGSVIKQCADCGEKYVETLPAKGHHYVATGSTEATCVQDGAAGYRCSVCGNTYTAVFPAFGHAETVTAAEAVSCETDGYTEYLCSTCGNVRREIYPAPGHEEQVTEQQEATCEEAGYAVYACSRCQQVRREIYPAPGHEEQVTEQQEATCEEAGYAVYACSRCQRVRRETLPAFGHAYSYTIVQETDGGYTVTGRCAHCGNVTVRHLTAGAKDNETEFGGWDVCGGNHTYVPQTNGVATCTKAGRQTYICIECGDLFTEDTPALGHDWEEEWTIDVPATETADGSKSHHCTRCDEKTDVTVIPKTGPVRTGWYTDPDTGLTYYYNEDGTLYTQELLELPNPEDPNTSLYYHFYPQYATVNGKNVEYSRLLGWVKMPGGIIRYYEEGARWFKTGFQYVGEERYFFDFYSGAQYIPPEEEWYQGMGWYVFTDPDTKIPSYYALDPENGGCFVYGLYTNSKGETYYFPLYQLGYATGFVTVDGETYYFDPATGIRVENETRTIGAATLTFGADGKVTKAVGLYLNKLYDADGNLVTEKGLVRGADGNLYYTTGNGDLYTSYWWNIDYRDESGSKKIYMLKGKVLEGLVTLTEEDLKITYNGEFLHEDLTTAGTYLFAGNSTEALTGFQTAENGLEYFFQPKKGGARYESWTFAGLTQPDDSTVLANFYGKGSVIDGVDYSFAHKVGLIKDTDGNLYYYEDGTEGPIKGKTVTVDGVQYELDATTGVASRVG